MDQGTTSARGARRGAYRDWLPRLPRIGRSVRATAAGRAARRELERSRNGRPDMTRKKDREPRNALRCAERSAASNTFFPFPQWLFQEYAGELGPYLITVYCALLSFRNNKSGACYP